MTTAPLRRATDISGSRQFECYRNTRNETPSKRPHNGQVDTRDQNPGSQEAALREVGCTRIFIDRGESSRIAERPQWNACLDYLREGGALVILALDRVAGTERIAIELIRDLGRRGVRLRSLTEPFLDIDTSTAMGESIISIMVLLANCAYRPFGKTRCVVSPTHEPRGALVDDQLP